MVRFGVEIEVLLAFRQGGPEARDLDHFSVLLAHAFNNNPASGSTRMGASVYDDMEPGALNQWTVTDDATLDADSEAQWPVEVISPILNSGTGLWRQEVTILWDVLEELCFLDTNETCGTHVHISPDKGSEWNPSLLKGLCYSLVYFEHAFEVLFPPKRRGNEYAKSNTYDNPQFLGKTNSEIFAMIGACSNNTGLVNLMNNGNHRYFTWNFTNLLIGGKGTVEFRRGPGVTAAEDCLSWMELAIYFVQVACHLDSPSALGDYPVTVEGLWSFISKGLEFETDKPLQIGLIFAGKSGSAVPTPVGPLSAEKQQKFAQKMNRDDKKQIMAQKFLKLL